MFISMLFVAIHFTTTDTPVTSTADYTVVTIVPTSDEERTSEVISMYMYYPLY